MQPSPGKNPIASDGAGRNRQHLGRLVFGKSAEKAQFHHAALARVNLLQTGERFINGDHPSARAWWREYFADTLNLDERHRPALSLDELSSAAQPTLLLEDNCHDT